MMKAARIHGYGADLVMEDVPVPEARLDQVLVRVKAASLNPLDVKLHSGAMHGFFPLPFPYTLGTDLTGTVEQVGPGVTGWQAGDAIVARLDPTSGGALAEFALLPANYLATAPKAVLLDDVARIPTAAGTAWQALFEVASLKDGQTVLVHAGPAALAASQSNSRGSQVHASSRQRQVPESKSPAASTPIR